MRPIMGPEERRSLLAYLWAREQGRCFWCGIEVVRPNGPGDNRPNVGTQDHVHLRSKGGKSTATNLVLACSECNTMRGDTPADAWAGRYGKTWKLKRFRSGVYADDRHDTAMTELYKAGIKPPAPPRPKKRRFVPR